MHGVVLCRSHCWRRLKNIPHRQTIWSGWIFSASLTHKLSSGVLATRYFGVQQYKYLFWKRLMVLINFQDCAANERESDNKTKHAGTSLIHFLFCFFQKFCTFRWILERVWAGPTAGLICFLFCAKVSHLLDYCELSNRFPRDQWDAALKFFLRKQEDSWRPDHFKKGEDYRWRQKGDHCRVVFQFLQRDPEAVSWLPASLRFFWNHWRPWEICTRCILLLLDDTRSCSITHLVKVFVLLGSWKMVTRWHVKQ